MLLMMTGITAVILMVIEIVICRNCPKISWQAVLPTLVSLTCVGMWVMFVLRPSVISYILGWISLGWTVGVLLGWGLFGVWKWMKKRNCDS